MDMTEDELNTWGTSFMEQFETDIKKHDADIWYEGDWDAVTEFFEENYELTEQQSDWVNDYLAEME